MTEHPAARTPVFYRADVSTLVTLHFVTCGLYDFFWSYRQWSAHQATHGRRIALLLRAWFWLFYTHALFRSLDARARAVGAEPKWRPNSQAWVVVGLLLCESVVGAFLEENAGAIAIFIICHTLRVFPLINAQRLSNEAHVLAWRLENDGDTEDTEGDDEGDEEEGEGDEEDESDQEGDDEEGDDEEGDDEEGDDEEGDDEEGDDGTASRA